MNAFSDSLESARGLVTAESAQDSNICNVTRQSQMMAKDDGEVVNLNGISNSYAQAETFKVQVLQQEPLSNNICLVQDSKEDQNNQAVLQSLEELIQLIEQKTNKYITQIDEQLYCNLNCISQKQVTYLNKANEELFTKLKAMNDAVGSQTALPAKKMDSIKQMLAQMVQSLKNYNVHQVQNIQQMNQEQSDLLLQLSKPKLNNFISTAKQQQLKIEQQQQVYVKQLEDIIQNQRSQLKLGNAKFYDLFDHAHKQMLQQLQQSGKMKLQSFSKNNESKQKFCQLMIENKEKGIQQGQQLHQQCND